MSSGQQVDIQDVLSNTAANLYAVFTDLRVVSLLGTPANSTSNAAPMGTVWTDSNYLYVATSNTVVKRISLSTF